VSKDKETGIEIDFTNLTNLQVDRIVEAVKVIADYNNEMKEVKESIREVLENVSFDLNADKDSTKRLKKYIRKASAIYWANKVEENMIDNTCVENIINKVEDTTKKVEETI
jgi:hypothetical protein